MGSAKWANPCWAGLLTALVRARCLEATLNVGSKNIISFQTDGVFSKRPGLPSFQGPENQTPLGSWEEKKYERIFLIQSGVYSITEYPSERDGEHNGETGDSKSSGGSGKLILKTRGMRSFEFEGAREAIEEAWALKGWTGTFDLPERKAFITIKLGLMWGRWDVIGCWLDQHRTLSFGSNHEKRELYDLDYAGPNGKTFFTTDGTTYAPGDLHKKYIKRVYGPHPLFPDDKKLADFSVRYTKELADAIWQKQKKDTEVWTQFAFHTPDEPFIMEE